MPNYFYVKNGGTAAGSAVDSADGVYSSKKTGTWASAFSAASEYFPSIEAACDSTNTITPDHGDFIMVSDEHEHEYSTTTTLFNIDLDPGSTEEPLTFISVDDTAVDEYKPATTKQEYVLGGFDIIFYGSNSDDNILSFHGLWFEADDDMYTSTAGADTDLTFYDCTLQVNGANDICYSGCAASFHRCTFNANGATGARWFYSTNTTGLKCYNCKFDTDQTAGMTAAIQAGFTASMELYDCDLSESNAQYIWDTVTSTDKSFTLYMENCAMPSSTYFVDWKEYTSSTGEQGGITAVGCGFTSAEAEYAYYRELNGNTAEATTAFYRDNSEAFTSGTQVSYKVQTAGNCTPTRPFHFKLPTLYAELSNAASDTVTIYILSSESGLTNSDVWVELSYPDGTNKHVRNLAISGIQDPLNTSGTALTTDTSTWTGRTTETRYKIEIPTSGDAGADGVPTIRVFVARASVTVYFCSTPELS
jgi:hypothetical protein